MKDKQPRKRAPGGGRKKKGPEKVEAYKVWLMPFEAAEAEKKFGSLTDALKAAITLTAWM